MKKKSLKSLKLNKNSVSNLGDLGLQGGNDRETIFGVTCGNDPTVLEATCIGISCNDVGCGGTTIGSGTGGGITGISGNICEFLTVS